MSSLSLSDKKLLESAFNMATGYVLDFTDVTFSEFFASLNIDINAEEYQKNGSSKANRLRTFWGICDDDIVGRSLVEMANEMMIDTLIKKSGANAAFLTTGAKAIYDEKRVMIQHVKEIGMKLLEKSNTSIIPKTTSATVTDNKINIEIRPEIYEHIKRYLDAGDYFHAIEEAYKIVRDKLHNITGYEQGHKAFDESNYTKIFGHLPKDDIEKDFFEGAKFLHMALQKFRNEKVHMLAHELDKNLAIHYLSLASLAYDLISRNNA